LVHDATSQFAGLILAGGEGSRWGGPKAFAKLDDGRTFLEACAATLVDAGARPALATLPPGTADPQITRLEVVALAEPGMDMFASLVIGLSRLMGTVGWRKVAVLPVDHPLVRAATVKILAVSDGPAVVPSFRGKHGHPVCLERSLAQAIVDGRCAGPTLRDVLHEAEAVDVAVDDPGVVANCNTPAALREALEAANSES
jgi:CTP:molybdopterin cytidylyltransferase MocA